MSRKRSELVSNKKNEKYFEKKDPLSETFKILSLRFGSVNHIGHFPRKHWTIDILVKLQQFWLLAFATESTFKIVIKST